MRNIISRSETRSDLDAPPSTRARAIAFVVCSVAVLWLVGCETTSLFSRKDSPPKIDSLPKALTAIRESRDPAVRLDAFAYLGNQRLFAEDDKRRDEIIEILALALAAETDPNSRITILRSLAEFGSSPPPSAIVTVVDRHSPNAAATIVQASNDKDPAVRVAVCRLLGRMGRRDVVQKLDSMLVSDSSLDVRLEAADALANLPYREAASALLTGLEDADVALRYRCRESLKKLTGTDHGGELAGWRQEIQREDFEQAAAKQKRFGLF